MKRIVAAVIAMLMLTAMFMLFASCSFAGSLDEETARQVLEEKLETSYYVMAAVYGDLLKVEESEKIDESWTVPHYFKITDDSHYKSIEQIKNDAQKVFTPTYIETIYEYAFEGNGEEMSRFSEKDGTFRMDVVKKPVGVLTNIYPETVKVEKSSRYAAIIKVECSANNGETRKELRINLSKIDGEWFFNGPTY